MTSATLQGERDNQTSNINAEFEMQLARLRVKFVDSLMERIFSLEEMNRTLQTDCDSTEALQGISNLSHRISGVAPTLGFLRIGELSSEIESRISDGLSKGMAVHETWCDSLPVLEELLDEMEALLEN